MRICIPIEFKPEGGGQYFLQLFATYLRDNGHYVTSNIEDRYEVLFTNHWVVPLGRILEAIRRNPNVRVVQRIDGAGVDYGRGGNVDRRQLAVNRLADLTIFQSKYCRWATREKFRVIAQDGPVVHNPVDVARFCPEGNRIQLAEKVAVASVSWSLNPRKGAEQVYAVAKANPDIGFYLCGRYTDVPAYPNVHPLGVLDRNALATTLRSCDVLLTFSQNEACPNHVLEALASGCPVLYEDTGAMREVIGDCGLAVRVDCVRAMLDELLPNRSWWSRRARQRTLERFRPDLVFARYLELIGETLGRPARLRSPLRNSLAFAGPLLTPFRRWGWA